MRKLLISAGTLVFVGALAIGVTGAYFSDTETSTGNVFTAGAIDLTVDSTQHYNNAICVNNPSETTGDYYWQLEPNAIANNPQYPVIGSPCDGTWAPTNLGAQKFFNFNDVKPGDSGENTISLHVDTNEAWACVDVHISKNDDVTCTDPENDAEGVNCTDPGVPGNSDLFDGDLAQNLNFFAWLDQGSVAGFQNSPQTPNADPQEGDNVWQGDAAEPHLFSNVFGPASDALNDKHYTLAAPPMQPLPAGGNTNYIGLAWCAGTMSVNNITGAISCDGAGMGNAAQTDSMVADIAFRVEQARNNSTFSCAPQVAPESGTVTLDKIVTFSAATIAGVDVTDFTLHLVGPGGDHVLVDQVPFPGLTAGAYVVSEVYSGNPANVTSDATFSGSCTEIGTTDTATLNVVAGVNPTCTITNSVSLL